MIEPFELQVENRFDGLPQDFIRSSVYQDFAYVGSKKKLERGHSLKPEGGREYGIYVTPRFAYARLYGPTTYRVLVQMLRPLIVPDKGSISPRDLTKEDAERVQRDGFDSIVSSVSGKVKRASEFVLFYSHQVFVLESTAA